MMHAQTLPALWRLRLAEWIEQPWLQRLLIALILINAVILGLETSPALMAAWGGWLVAADRLGGRAWTRTVEGHPLDLGCAWLHSGDRNHETTPESHEFRRPCARYNNTAMLTN